MTEHTCELPLKQKNQFSFVLIKPLTFRKVWTVWCGISKYTPKCSIYKDSLAAITAERRRHAGLKHWWIIHPFSYARYVSIFYIHVIFLLKMYKKLSKIYFINAIFIFRRKRTRR